MEPTATCPRCGHLVLHHRHHEDDLGLRYGSKHYCDERMSYDNNDFCGCTEGAPPKQTYTFYAVADRDDLATARWYRTYSSSHGSGYVKELEDAKIWNKRSSAKSKCTALGPSARLVEFVVTKVNVIDNSEQVRRAAEKRRQEEERRAEALKRSQLEQAERDVERAQERLRKLREQR